VRQEIVPNLWFDTEAEEAAEFYTSVFKNSRIVNVAHYTEAGPRPAGMVMTVEFELDGQRFVGINGGPEFKFDEAVSFQINLRDPGGDRLLLGAAVRGRRGRAVRLAQGQVRPVVAGHSDRDGRAVRRSGPEAG
jgi:uncharacterized glyoxalase superfamily protein PhnB